MGMNIKNPEAHRLAREVAAATGESVTGAVTRSLRERLDRLHAERRQGVAAALLAVGRDVAGRLPPDQRIGDPADVLFDERGLPR